MVTISMSMSMSEVGAERKKVLRFIGDVYRAIDF